jgi:uncharacterized protein (DUF433 family)
MQKQLRQIIVSDPEVMMGKPVIAGTLTVGGKRLISHILQTTTI